jgi:hypothetical protein
MSLKSIRESYAGLINAFAEAGVKLDESQKASLDTFIVALESKMSKQKEATVKATKKIVTEHLEKQYKNVFESIKIFVKNLSICAFFILKFSRKRTKMLHG